MSATELKGEATGDDERIVMSATHTSDAPLQQPLAAAYSAESSEASPVSDAPGLAAADGQTDSAQESTGVGNSNSDDNSDSADHVKHVILPIFQTMATMLSVTAWTIMLLLVSFVITLYVALNPDVYRRGILWMIPSEHEAVATLTMARMCVTLRWWMLGRLASMLAIGLLTSLGMWLIGMPAPLALGALAGLLSFVPNIGPIVAAVPGLFLAVPDGAWMLLSALGVYVVAQIVESNLISPLVDQYTVTTPPAVLIVGQVIMGVLAGAWGVLIATPLLVVVLVLIQQLYVREYIQKPIKVIGSTDSEPPERGSDSELAR
jgi:predicted PurR-regulated permease PerM